MKKLINIYKKGGETPLEAIHRFRSVHTEYEGIPITYAGRLDPMAEGVLILLTGDEAKKKDEYLKLDKEYRFEVLFGFSTDTFDVLGKNTSIVNTIVNTSEVVESDIKKALTSFIGTHAQAYPPYSSKPVEGKPLFVWAREGKLDEIEIPTHIIEVYSIELKQYKKINKTVLEKNIKEKISLVHGDFRQSEILESWEKSLLQSANEELVIATIMIRASSGTYVRTIANEIGKKLGVPSLTYSIVRTKVGEHTTEDSLK
ncbi:hypothetical protein COB64_04090 [Candidatus Wolfebacteria bacterium]|nr:MAG: hypothetical protein COB64_04090 [Candidatus Wolfebacteria bacterium]